MYIITYCVWAFEQSSHALLAYCHVAGGHCMFVGAISFQTHVAVSAALYVALPGEYALLGRQKSKQEGADAIHVPLIEVCL